MSNQWINYHHLYYFRTIANEGGIARASRKLRLGQPTLSTQLKLFEETIGHQLFDREKRKLVLTEAGRMTLEYANEIFRLGTELIETLNDRLSHDRLELQVGALDTIPKHLLLKLVQHARDQFNCKVNVIEGSFSDLLLQLQEHRLDMLLSDVAPHSDGIKTKSRIVAKMHVLIVGAPKFADLKKNFPASLENQPFVIPALSGRIRDEVLAYLREKEIGVDIVAEVQDTSLLKLLATHEAGLAPVPDSAAKEFLDNGSLVKIGELADVTEDLWMTVADRKIQNPAAAALYKSFRI